MALTAGPMVLCMLNSREMGSAANSIMLRVVLRVLELPLMLAPLSILHALRLLDEEVLLLLSV